MVFANLFWFLFQRLFGKRQRVRPKASAEERWAGHEPRRGCPQAPSCGQVACPRRTRVLGLRHGACARFRGSIGMVVMERAQVAQLMRAAASFIR